MKNYYFQLFKGLFFYCDGPDVIAQNISNKAECLQYEDNRWINQKYNFDNLGGALMSLFVLSSKDGWVDIMYHGLDAVGIDQQVRQAVREYKTTDSFITNSGVLCCKVTTFSI